MQKRNYKFLVELLYLFKNTTNQTQMDKVNQIKHMMNFGASIQARPIDDMRDYFMSSCFKIELPFNRFRLCIFTKLYPIFQ